MCRRRAQVLAESDDLDSDGTKVAEGGDYLAAVSPMPKMIPDLVVQPAAADRASTDRLPRTRPRAAQHVAAG